MKHLKNLFLVAMFIVTSAMFSQGTITGTVMDVDGPLPGADVIVMGTTKGASTDFDGNFSVDVPSNTGNLQVSFVGYTKKTIPFTLKNGQLNIGSILLDADGEAISDIVLTATSFAIDRKTPVAVSTVKAAVIEDKLGTQEFPEILKSTPGVYATKSGGGFGDGRLNLRGFNSENVAVMINGVPVNDMENGRVYWSNWAGLSDVTSAMQVQRGLGASKVAVPSIGGTINILSKTTDVNKGGSVRATVGTDGYLKYGATLSTGLLDNGFAVTVSAAKTQGDGYVDGTQFVGYNYFINISNQINDAHKLSITSFGAPQRHGQRQNRSLISTYRNSESGIRFNPDWGYKNGQVVHVEDNFYHKSQTSLNHEWTISDKSLLSTALYVSWGTGGGGGTAGSNRGLFNNRIGGFDQPIDLDNIVSINRANGALGSEAILRASRNDHNWYGALSTYKTALTENVDFLAGLDLRSYTGSHFREVTDLLGGDYFLDNSDVNNPNVALNVGDKFAYNNDGNVGWQGFFMQAEYDKEKLAAFISASFSNTSYQRVDYFNYLDSDPIQTTDKYNFIGYGTKGGANYNLSDIHNVFVNVGYFEKAPEFGAVFQRFDNEHINDQAENQKIFSTEIGYGLRGEKLAANINLYRTTWKDRTFTRGLRDADGNDFTANILGVNALHQGVEFDFTFKASDKLKFNGMLSVGDWSWDNDITGTKIFDNAQNEIATIDLLIKGLKVSDAAQTTAALGMNYKFLEKSSFSIDYNYYDNLYADFDILGSANIVFTGDPAVTPTRPSDTWKAPSYGLFDVSLKHGFKIGSLDASVTGRLNNVFDTEYVSDALNGTGSNAATALVWFGRGRSFNVSTKIKF